jgi:hypothetical protein
MADPIVSESQYADRADGVDGTATSFAWTVSHRHDEPGTYISRPCACDHVAMDDSTFPTPQNRNRPTHPPQRLPPLPPPEDPKIVWPLTIKEAEQPTS